MAAMSTTAYPNCRAWTARRRKASRTSLDSERPSGHSMAMRGFLTLNHSTARHPTQDDSASATIGVPPETTRAWRVLIYFIAGLIKPALLLGETGSRHLHPGWLALTPTGGHDPHLADLTQVLQQRRDRPLDPLAVKLTTQQAAQQQGQHTVEHMDADLLVGPMPLRTQAHMVRALQAAKRRFHLVLAPRAAHDLRVAPTRL